MELNNSPALYIHVPFCQRKCRYCAFYSLTQHNIETYHTYLNHVLRNLTIFQNWIQSSQLSLDTLYWGGGTPSLLPVEHIAKVMSNIFSFSQPQEITLEVNPGTITKKDLENYYSLKINRISIGVQSLDNQVLSWLGRIHTAQQSEQCLAWVAKNFSNYSADVIYAIPNIPKNILEKTLKKLVFDYHVPHISTYSLTIEENTPLAKLGIETIAEQFEEEYTFIHDYLTSNGYEHYEVSNFALPGFRSLHNSKYWTRTPYIGIGPQSHSLWQERRFSFEDWTDFCDCQNDIDKKFNQAEILSGKDIYEEKIMLGLRTQEGISKNIIKQDIKILQTMQEYKLIEINSNDNIRATLKGWMVLNQIIAALI